MNEDINHMFINNNKVFGYQHSHRLANALNRDMHRGVYYSVLPVCLRSVRFARQLCALGLLELILIITIMMIIIIISIIIIIIIIHTSPHSTLCIVQFCSLHSDIFHPPRRGKL